MDKNTAKALRIILANRYMTLATAGEDSQPWAAPMYYSTDEELNFYFVCSNRARHSRHVSSNGQAAIAVFDSALPPEEQDGVQISGRASLVGILELPHVVANYYRKRFPDPAERSLHNTSPKRFRGIGSLRFYKVVPEHIYTLDLTYTKNDRRVEVRIRPDDVREMQRSMSEDG